MTVCLGMVARNEAERIGHAIESAAGLIDEIYILDTGSTDNTQEIAESYGAVVERREWRGFADARTRLLQWAAQDSGCDYTFTLDADMTINGTLPDELDADAYFITVIDRTSWRLPLLTSTKVDWRYEGVTHSYLACDSTYRGENLDTLEIIHHGRPGARVDKFINDVGLLTMDLLENPDNVRSVYYLAQSYKDLGELRKAAELYAHRASLGGWPEEQFHAKFREGQCWLQSGEENKAILALLDAWAMRPTRAEPLRELAWLYRYRRRNEQMALMFEQQADQLPLPTDRLFVDRQSYTPNLPPSDLLPETDVPECVLLEDDGWMLPRDFDGYLAAIVREHKPGLLVECGSGASTVVLAKLQAEHGGRLVSLEHNEMFYERTQKMLELNQQKIDLVLCPLGQVRAWQWYTNVPEFRDGEIDMLIVDGPPANSARLARYPALPLLAHALAEGAPVMLDDANRPEEKEILRRWCNEFEIGGEMLTHSKAQTALLEWRPRQ